MIGVLRKALLLGICVASATAASQAPTPRTFVFLSDLHLGVGYVQPGKFANQEDFRWHDDLVALLEHIGGGDASATDLVLLGDTFELWQSPFQKCQGEGVEFGCVTLDCRPEKNGRDHGCTEAEALARIKHVLDQHADTIRALREFAFRGENRLTLVPGNHDAALLLPDVKAEVLRRFGDADQKRIKIAAAGYWVSDDKRIFGDHGHMPDKVNRFEHWPEPWAITPAGRVMLQPWGERMVQEFYNQYEELLPAIDNMTDEAAGMRLAIKALGPQQMGNALKRFLAFLAFDTTLRQKLSSLGRGAADNGDLMLGSTPPRDVWDISGIRAGNTKEFFVQSMPLDELRLVAQQTESDLSWDGVSDEDIAELCEQRAVLIAYYAAHPAQRVPAEAKIEPCPVKPDAERSLGRVADQVLNRDAANRRKHLRAASGEVSKRFEVYVYGHTHSAASPFKQKIQNLWQASVVNTGAFQRLASSDEIQRMAAGSGETATQVFAKLLPEQMKPCYSFVRIRPYVPDGKPKVELMWWALEAGKFDEHASCP